MDDVIPEIEDDIEIRATQATIEDISLTLPDDVNQQLLSTLRIQSMLPA